MRFFKGFKMPATGHDDISPLSPTSVRGKEWLARIFV